MELLLCQQRSNQKNPLLVSKSKQRGANLRNKQPGPNSFPNKTPDPNFHGTFLQLLPSPSSQFFLMVDSLATKRNYPCSNTHEVTPDTRSHLQTALVVRISHASRSRLLLLGKNSLHCCFASLIKHRDLLSILSHLQTMFVVNPSGVGGLMVRADVLCVFSAR